MTTRLSFASDTLPYHGRVYSREREIFAWSVFVCRIGAVAVIVAAHRIAAWSGIVGQGGGGCRRAREQEPIQQKQMLQSLRTRRARRHFDPRISNQELHLQLDETRAQGAAQARRLQS